MNFDFDSAFDGGDSRRRSKTLPQKYPAYKEGPSLWKVFAVLFAVVFVMLMIAVATRERLEPLPTDSNRIYGVIPRYR